MNKKNLEDLAFENPNDFELGGKIREMANDADFEEEPKEKNNWKELYARLAADFDNYRKRTNKEKEELVNRTINNMLDPLMDIDSDISIASLQIKDEGIQMIVSKLGKFLSSYGIESIQTDKHDVDVHDVAAIIESDQDTNSIVGVVAKGYRKGDKIIRHPKVILSK